MFDIQKEGWENKLETKRKKRRENFLQVAFPKVDQKIQKKNEKKKKKIFQDSEREK